MSRFAGASQVVEARLTAILKLIEEHMKADCLMYDGPMLSGAEDFIRNAVEDLGNLPDKKRKLVFILETDGGYAEVVRRISDALRHHYRVVDFLVPSHAMSAGTILVMSGDAIHMDYHSVLGPIDPQVENQDGNSIPALGYLVRYEELLDKANSGTISTAEMGILLNFDQGNLYSYQQARDLAVALLEEWLVKYKFKDWRKTETTKTNVTLQMKRDRAKQIGQKLNDVKRWNSHGLGISMERLRRELNLKIDDFGEDPELHQHVRRYHTLLKDYMGANSHHSVIHTREGYEPLRMNT
ncbi:SDH family Clp fold serine proteinase [Bradyrhizobium sp.]|uniref:SDH family Clp fold serine proteinase n=1 Tax=Bradyrhizobium sp. TaxID=376 RepID=UPI003C6EB725